MWICGEKCGFLATNADLLQTWLCNLQLKPIFGNIRNIQHTSRKSTPKTRENRPFINTSVVSTDVCSIWRRAGQRSIFSPEPKSILNRSTVMFTVFRIALNYTCDPANWILFGIKANQRLFTVEVEHESHRVPLSSPTWK